jgi:crotonobetainyl-CoA:carnitine CoA-transferase CaiB-like acyl-CoA transferase
MPGALEGVRVIDLTAVLLGPLATQHLADMGADVIKVEPPEGDLLRVAGGAMGNDRRMGPIYLAANRNKRSICLDLKKPGAMAAVKDLVKRADLFIHNSRPQAIERWASATRTSSRSTRRSCTPTRSATRGAAPTATSQRSTTSCRA